MPAIALIPLTKRYLPVSAMRLLAGRPLAEWVISAARDSGVFEEVVALTDDEQVAAAARNSGAGICQESPDKSLVEGVARVLGEKTHIEAAAVLMASCPLTQPKHLQAAWKRFEEDRADALVSVTRDRRFPWFSGGLPRHERLEEHPLHDGWAGYLAESGAFYYFRRNLVEESQRLIDGRVIPFELPGKTRWRIESDEDWEPMEILVRRHGYYPAVKPIRLVALDVDGVLNDAGFYYSEEKEVMKKFNTRDGAGIKQLMTAGVTVGLITGEKTGFAPARAAKLGIGRIELGCSNKLPVLNKWRQEFGLEWNEVAYMGDDIADAECVEAAGMGACPRDAEPEVRAVAKFIAPSDGGRGCVRDLVRYLLATGRVK